MTVTALKRPASAAPVPKPAATVHTIPRPRNGWGRLKRLGQAALTNIVPPVVVVLTLLASGSFCWRRAAPHCPRRWRSGSSRAI